MLYEYLLLKISLPSSSFVKTDKQILKYVRKCKGTGIAKTNLEKNKVGELVLSNFKSYYKAIVINNLCCWHKDKHRSVEQNALTQIVN